MSFEEGYKMVEIVQCQVCSNTETNLIQNTHVGLGSAEINLVKCKQCGLVYLNPQPTKNEIEQLYSDEYFLQWYSTEEKRNFSKQFFRDLFIKNKLILNAGCKVLDIGCGMGFFLEVAREWLCEVKGVEISEYASKYCQEKLNLDVHYGTLKTANYPSEYFDVITAFDVLEHLEKLPDFLSIVKNIMKKDGIFIVLVPNYNSTVFQMDRIICGLKKAPMPNVPEHLTYFTIDSLERLLRKHGFQIKKILSAGANDDYEFLRIQGSLPAIVKSVLCNLSYLLGKLSNRRETILAVAENV